MTAREMNLTFDVTWARGAEHGTVVITAENELAARLDAANFLRTHGLTPAIIDIQKRDA